MAAEEREQLHGNVIFVGIARETTDRALVASLQYQGANIGMILSCEV